MLISRREDKPRTYSRNSIIFSRIWRSLATLALLNCLFPTVSHAQPLCGESNGDGSWNIADFTYSWDYLIAGGPAPFDLGIADLDNHIGLNAADISFFSCIGLCHPVFLTCPPTEPRIFATTDPDFYLRHPSTIPAGLSSTTITLELQIPDSVISLGGANTLVAQILIDGLPANIDSIEFPLPDYTGSGRSSVRPDSAIIILSNFGVSSQKTFQNGPLAKIIVAFPESPVERSITVNLIATSPEQSPTPDSSLYTMYAIGWPVTWVEPTITVHCCLVPGDANFDGKFNIADVIFGIARIFTDGQAYHCQDAADANGDNSYNIADVTYSIARIFAGGPAPVCGITGL